MVAFKIITEIILLYGVMIVSKVDATEEAPKDGANRHHNIVETSSDNNKLTRTKEISTEGSAVTEMNRENRERGMIEIVDDDHFQKEMKKHPGKLIVVDYTATWCGPCKRIEPYLNELSSKYPEVVFLKVNINKCVAAHNAANIQNTVPTFVYYRDEKELKRFLGAKKEEINSRVVQCSEEQHSEDKSITSDASDRVMKTQHSN